MESNSCPFSDTNTTHVMEKQTKLFSDVVIIGAGISGINMACQLQQKLQITDFVIYDRAAEVGGAWAANRCNFILSFLRPHFHLLCLDAWRFLSRRLIFEIRSRMRS